MSSKKRRRNFVQRISIDELADRTARPMSATPRPFLRWAGSKQKLLAEIIDVLPSRYGTYYEPFLGSGAMFFLLEPERAVLSDVCVELIETYEAIRDRAGMIERYLKSMRPNRTQFLRVRSNRSWGPYKRAAEFIYLNKTCWNGLYRVNRDGEFNVPFGKPKTNVLADYENIKACARALNAEDVRLAACSFSEALTDAKAGDLVFLDPPYVTGHNNNGFIDYNEKLFSWKDQESLASEATRLVSKGVHVVVMNASHRAVLDLYEGFEVRRLRRSSTLANDVSKRGRVAEALIYRSP